METTRGVKVTLFDSKGNKSTDWSSIAVDSIVSIYVNGKFVCDIEVTPYLLKQAAIGHLITEGYLDDVNEIESVFVGKEDINIKAGPELDFRLDGITEEYLLEKYSKIEQLQCNFKLDKDIVYKKHKVLTERSSLGKNVSSIYSNGLFDANGNEFIAEDTNKNMAFSKVVGKAVLEKFDFRRSFLLANYTPNGELVLKCCRLGIPIIVSTRTPLNSAVEISNKYNITLTELNSKLKVYSAPMRIN